MGEGLPGSASRVYVGVGSNLGHRMENCLKAIDAVDGLPGCDVTNRSRFYRTEPVGVEDQDWYVNGVICLRTDMDAQAFLQALLAIETAMGRERKKRWDSRVIDLDILLFKGRVIREADLEIPHPLMHLRRFVLAPMVELAPEEVHPLMARTMAQLLEALPDQGQAVFPLGEA